MPDWPENGLGQIAAAGAATGAAAAMEVVAVVAAGTSVPAVEMAVVGETLVDSQVVVVVGA